MKRVIDKLAKTNNVPYYNYPLDMNGQFLFSIQNPENDDDVFVVEIQDTGGTYNNAVMDIKDIKEFAQNLLDWCSVLDSEIK